MSRNIIHSIKKKIRNALWLEFVGLEVIFSEFEEIATLSYNCSSIISLVPKTKMEKFLKCMYIFRLIFIDDIII